MKRLPYERPTDHYDMRIKQIDEQLCELLKQRKDISGNNPGYPPFDFITQWAANHGFYDEYLKVVFGMLLNEHLFKPVVEPAGFRKHIALLWSKESNGYFLTIPSVMQYENASVVTLHIDWDIASEYELLSPRRLPPMELEIGPGYSCRFDSGNGSGGHNSNSFVITPPLPDDMSGIEFSFRHTLQSPPGNKPFIGDFVLRAE